VKIGNKKNLKGELEGRDLQEFTASGGGEKMQAILENYTGEGE